jgi:hypothetical protein
MLARIMHVFGPGDELWGEARVDKRMVLRFRLPAGLGLGDVISYDPRFLDQDSGVAVFRYVESAVIHVRSQDTKDLSDRRIIADLNFRKSSTRIILRATGELEITGVSPERFHEGGGSRFDDVAGFVEYINSSKEWLTPKWNSEGPLKIRKAVLKWIKGTAIPKLRAAEKKLGPRRNSWKYKNWRRGIGGH